MVSALEKTPDYVMRAVYQNMEVRSIVKNGIKVIIITLAVAVVTGALHLGYTTFYKAAYPLKYTDLVETAGVDTGLDKSLLYAVIRTESGFCEDAQSSVGARGLMQITPDTMNWVRYRMGETGAVQPELLFRPEANIHYGAQTLSLLLEEFGSLPTALAAYHAGWGNVTRWLDDTRYSEDGESLHCIPFMDTDSYVTKVLSTAQMYRAVYDLP